MERVAIHQYQRGKRANGGKFSHYEVVTGLNPFGPRGGSGGKWVDGTLRKHFWGKDKAREYARHLAAAECLEFIDPWYEKISLLSVAELSPTAVSPLSVVTTLFDPELVIDTRRKKMIEVALRLGQQKFRDEVLVAYSGTCSISQSKVKDVLEAAHISPYLGDASNHICNGLLLRADIHKLFDKFLIAVDSTHKVRVSRKLLDTEYWLLDRKSLLLPMVNGKQPSRKALEEHCNIFSALELDRNDS